MKTLLEVPEGRTVRVVDVAAGKGAAAMLYELGIRPGARVEVVKSGPGPVIVRVGGAKYSLGRGLAAKVIVEEEQG
ncbi:FeoA family protein [Methanopyrus kandleri]|uniref:FeoA family protein n=1 Tax=Methanopyrus kandleri TaxID=2320 RepID=UPI0011E55BFF|nr:ferrous iron transport protein A [Methanopyrus kandleri]